MIWCHVVAQIRGSDSSGFEATTDDYGDRESRYRRHVPARITVITGRLGVPSAHHRCASACEPRPVGIGRLGSTDILDPPPLYSDRPVQGGVFFRFRHFPYNFNREISPNLRSPCTRGGYFFDGGIFRGYQLIGHGSEPGDT